MKADWNRRTSSWLLQIRGFPTIKIFRKGEEPEDYQGGRSRGDIIARAMDLFSDNAPPPELVEVSAPPGSPPPPLSSDRLLTRWRRSPWQFSVQIVNEDVVKKTCGDSQLCVIAVLPHILDTGKAVTSPGSGGFHSAYRKSQVTSVRPAPSLASGPPS